LIVLYNLDIIVSAERCLLCRKVVSSLHNWKTKQNGKCVRLSFIK